MAIKREDSVVVYQVGRVGSKAVVKAVQKAGFYKVYHTHHFDTNGKPLTTNTGVRLDSLLENPKYITIVKDPVARNLSSFLFDVKRHISSYAWKEELSEEFKYDYFKKLFKHDYILNWFDTEFKQNVGLNVYKHKFYAKKGYTIIDNVLILQSERLSEVFHKATREFLNVEIQIKQQGNAYVPKYYGIAKHLEQSYMDEMYSSKYMKHFYTHSQIQGFRNKWMNI